MKLEKFNLTNNGVTIAGGVMLAYFISGGAAATWVQLVKTILLLGATVLLALLVLAQFGFNPLALFQAAADKYGTAILAPGKQASNPLDTISLGMSLDFGTAGVPHIFRRFYTLPNAKIARNSLTDVCHAINRLFFLLTFVLGFGSMVLVGQDPIQQIDAGGNMAVLLLAKVWGGSALLGLIAAVFFVAIVAVVAELTFSGATARSRDLWFNAVRHSRPLRQVPEFSAADCRRYRDVHYCVTPHPEPVEVPAVAIYKLIYRGATHYKLIYQGNTFSVNRNA